MPVDDSVLLMNNYYNSKVVHATSELGNLIGSIQLLS